MHEDLYARGCISIYGAWFNSQSSATNDTVQWGRLAVLIALPKNPPTSSWKMRARAGSANVKAQAVKEHHPKLQDGRGAVIGGRPTWTQSSHSRTTPRSVRIHGPTTWSRIIHGVISTESDQDLNSEEVGMSLLTHVKHQDY